MNWLAGVVAAFATLFGIGRMVPGLGTGLLLLAIALGSFLWTSKSLKSISSTETA